MNKDNRRAALIIILTIGMLGGLFYYPRVNNVVPNNGASVADSARSVPCIAPDVPLARHIHAKLEIIINGRQIAVPGDVGRDRVCDRVLHTHSDAGDENLIHVEAQDNRSYTLGDFFGVWNNIFNRDEILGNKADRDHAIIMTVNGQSSDEFENLILQDQQIIKIEYGAAAKK